MACRASSSLLNTTWLKWNSFVTIRVCHSSSQTCRILGLSRTTRTVAVKAPRFGAVHPRLLVSQQMFHSTAKSSSTASAAIQTEAETDKGETVEDEKHGGNESDLFKTLPPLDGHRLLTLMTEYSMLLQEGRDLPKVMPNKKWLQLLENPTSSRFSRLKTYNYWLQIERRKAKARQKKDELAAQKAERQSPEEERDSDDFKNTFLLYLHKQTVNRHYNNNLAHAMVYGIPLVIDLGFESSMTKVELSGLFKQIRLLIAVMRTLPEPFHLHLCGLVPGSKTDELLRNYVQDIDTLPITVTETGYLDHYEHNSLVYMSPDSPRILTKFDPTDVYIIGGIVDTSPKPKLSFPKAKKENLRSAKLPLDNYFKWQAGAGKYLTIDQMGMILHELKNSKNWDKALRFVPRRRVVEMNSKN